MPTPKLQTSRALAVIPSDTVPIPNPFPMSSGTATSTVIDVLDDSTKDFVALGIRAGDVVYNLNSNTCTTVLFDPTSGAPNELALTDDIMVSGDKYTIYQNSPLSGEPNAGCVLYVGTGGDITAVTAGGDTVTFSQVPTGTFVPVNVVQVLASGTDADKILALW
jgi:hypothetical protein